MSYKGDYETSRRGAKKQQDIRLQDLHRDWYHVFERFKPNRNGEVRLSDMRRYLSTPELRTYIPEDAIDSILRLADKNQNGMISYDEFLDMVVGYDYMASDRPFVRSALRAAAYTVVPRNERRYLAEYSCCPPPLFMILISFVELGVFLYYTVPLVQDRGLIGLSGPVPFDSILIYDPYRRYEAWRFVSYMLVHAGLTHIIFNIIMQLVLGVPLEMVHRWWRIMIVYLSGVVAGSLATSVTDSNVFLCGASGGVYALITAHLASVILNWKEMEFAWFRLIAFIVLTGTDVGVAVYDRVILEKQTKVGYMAHLGGAVAGLLIGINVLRNLRKRRWEKVVWWCSLTLYLLLMIAAIVWNVLSVDGYFPKPRYN
ncbi:Rhomboid-related protein 3 [Orchesella cincta]|uniref:rhomboid protease n=1 Tax=Orchesella cincta TaxID=48709 RepID=A0A1D2NKA9_ORCCI|nr:Rhomboid-related protein 3 [Orchesella cincta]